jgi:hypothetical protein
MSNQALSTRTRTQSGGIICASSLAMVTRNVKLVAVVPDPGDTVPDLISMS